MNGPRRRWWRRATASVRLRVTVLAAMTFAAALVGISVVGLRMLESRLIDDVRQADEQVLLSQALVGGQMLDVEEAPPAGSSEASGPGAVGAGDATQVRAVLSPTGELVVAIHSQAADPAAQPTQEGVVADNFTYTVANGGVPGPLQTPLDHETASLLGLAADDGSARLITSFQVSPDLTLVTSSSLSEVENTLDRIRTLLWWTLPLLIVAVAGLAWMVVGRALRPVHAVTSRVAAIGSHSLHERVPVRDGADEIGELATTMNSMLDRLESATLVTRQLVSDASHELRTPIAVLRAELEVARRSADTDWTAVSDEMLSEIDRLQGLVDDLLLLARIGERGTSDEQVALDDLVRDVAGRRRQVPVEVEIPTEGPPISVTGDADAVRRALDHVVANAARHATSEVDIRLDRAAGAVVVHVDDDGPGIALADRQRVFERFVRLDEGRARDGGGSGLGLAVVGDVMRAHHGAAEVDDSPLGGTRLTLTFPTPS